MQINIDKLNTHTVRSNIHYSTLCVCFLFFSQALWPRSQKSWKKAGTLLHQQTLTVTRVLSLVSHLRLAAGGVGARRSCPEGSNETCFDLFCCVIYIVLMVYFCKWTSGVIIRWCHSLRNTHTPFQECSLIPDCTELCLSLYTEKCT